MRWMPVQQVRAIQTRATLEVLALVWRQASSSVDVQSTATVNDVNTVSHARSDFVTVYLFLTHVVER